MTQKYTLNPSERFQVRILVGLQTSRLAILRLRGSKLSIDYGVWGTAERSTLDQDEQAWWKGDAGLRFESFLVSKDRSN